MFQRRRLVALLSLSVLSLSLVAQALLGASASAAQITSRSLTLEAGATDGGSKPGGVVKHLFAFTLPTNGTLGSIKFLYCTLPGALTDPCTTPTGLVTTTATLTLQTGATGFTIVNTTNGAPYITRTAASTGAVNTAVSYELSTITNPTTTNQTFFVRIASFASIDTTGASTDTGTVAASTATPIDLTGTMPESLVFCTGATVTTNLSGVPDCSTATPGAVSFNQLFSPTDTATATSQMAASTNAGSGYSITVNGPTLTSGSNTITAMAAAAAGVRGTSQFGLNLRANTVATSTPAVGTDVAPAAGAAGGTYKGEPATGYGTVDQFKFVSGNSVADSAFGGAGPTDAQIFTVSYIVNVSGSQAAGTYTATLTYICTATY